MPRVPSGGAGTGIRNALVWCIGMSRAPHEGIFSAPEAARNRADDGARHCTLLGHNFFSFFNSWLWVGRRRCPASWHASCFILASAMIVHGVVGRPPTACYNVDWTQPPGDRQQADYPITSLIQ
ncbi:hypothetical protein BEI_3507 [Halomonas beimenensis]|uniref:Uncharacterized protein n=1 Tax=Halomonas beimenensis TaxID=475662 RepID=A0A291PC64_9GAMM|nr:hypothetical protein BEI_3507 [Halomonas beimenensis]